MNLQPPVLETGALPIELHSYLIDCRTILQSKLFSLFKNNMFTNDWIIFFKLYSAWVQSFAFSNSISVTCTSCTFKMNNCSFAISSHRILRYNICYNTGANSMTTFSNSKPQFFIHSDRGD